MRLWLLLILTACASENALPVAPVAATPPAAPSSSARAELAKADPPPAPPDERALAIVQRARLAFQMPKGFSFVKVAENEQFEPTFAVKDDEGLIEVQYAVEPLDELVEKRKQCETSGDCRGPAPGLMAFGLVAAATSNLCAQTSKAEQYDADVLRMTFRSDQGWIQKCRTRSDYSLPDRDALLVVLIRDDAASVMMLFLPSDMSRSRAAFDRAFRALRFAEPLP